MKKIVQAFSIFSLLLFPLHIFSQFCAGSLGAPVVNITFGSGSNPGPTLSQAVPGASTTYTYQLNTATDGFYTIVNAVPANSAWFTGAPDHTGDPNGYFAFFNADPTPGGEFYRQTVNNLCGGTTYEFATWVASVLNVNILPSAISPNITFKILDATNGSVLATSNTGDIPNVAVMTWSQYSLLFTTPAGVNSVVLVLSNNNVGGNAQPGNDLAIDDITFRACGPLTNASFANNSQVDSTGISSCSAVNLFGKITGSFNNPSYQWQISSDGGLSFSNIPGATGLNLSVNNLTNGQYQFRLLSAETGNINSSSCRFISNLVKLSVTGCSSINGIGSVINTYTPVIAYNPCDNKITVEDASTFNIGDTVLMIQMKGAEIDSTNTASFGNILNYKNAGNYEFNYVKGKAGNIVELKNVLTRAYDIPDGKVQLIRVPFYNNVTVTSTLTCLPWDGRKGGVLVFKVQDSLNLQADIDVSDKGFNGGKGTVFFGGSFNCFLNGYYMPFNFDSSAMKGESITSLSQLKMYAKGKNAGGGGGMNHNGGGAGGGNGGTGGTGGFPHINCSNRTTNFSLGGIPLNYNNAFNKTFMGSGGGAGQANNGSDASGANGGGLVIISSRYLAGNSKSIISNGGNAIRCNTTGNPNLSPCHDGGGGGGAGGSILLDIPNIINTTSIKANGGNGADLTYLGGSSAGLGPLGPGAGGGGGVIWVKNNTVSPALTVSNTGGVNGVILNDGNIAWGANPGSSGVAVTNLSLPADGPLFKPNIDSVRIADTLSACKTISFKGQAFVQANAIQNWQWSFGDNTGASTQNATHTYTNTGTYTVKLVATDVNGCKDSVIKQVAVINCPTSTSTIINTYTPVVAFNPCDNKITVEDASTFKIGDTVLMIQMKGAIIDSSNTALFGSVPSYRNAGNYDFNFVKSKAGNIIELKNVLLSQYDVPNGKVQLIRVPYFQTYRGTDTLTCLPWDGRKGGVLVLNAKDSVVLNADINVTGKGFRGGNSANPFTNALSCGTNGYFYPNTSTIAAAKGESIYDIGAATSYGRGNNANGGGGGNGHNSGGGGGGNGGSGGFGGKELDACNNASLDNRGIGGSELPVTAGINKIFLGGGGGSGHTDNVGGIDMNGANGGGIAFVITNYFKNNNYKIIANGDSVINCDNAINNCHDASGGGGSGGTVLMQVNNYINTVNVESKGGKGGDLVIFNIAAGAGRIGPGGGGGGGVIWLNQGATPPTISPFLNGGANGTIPADGNNAWGSTPGLPGLSKFNLVIPFDISPFKPSIDSVSIKDSATSCSSFDFKGEAFLQPPNSIQDWQWTFGDNTGANTQNTSHTYASAGTYNIKLVVTDISGCKDSITKSESTFGASGDFYYRQDVCNPFTLQFFGVNASSTPGNWEIGPAIFNNTNNPVYTFAAPGSFTVKYIFTNGLCADTVTKIIQAGITPANIIITPDTTICINSTKLLRTISSSAFCWSPTNFLDNPALANPTTATTQPITYFFTAAIEGNNLATNPGFSAGNNSFTSQYIPSNTNTAIGQYFVGPNPQTWNASLSNCVDHTSGSGNMLLVNSDATTNAQVWAQTVTVTPNTNYSFGTWVQSLSATNPARLSFAINGNDADTVITATSTACTWQQFHTSWNSGNNTSASIAIVNKGTTAQNSHFALDDISFAPVLIQRDSVTISIDTPFIKTIEDTASCRGVQIQLSTTGGNTYHWQPVTGLSDSLSANPVASPADSIQYFVTGTTIHGCIGKDSVTVAVKPSPKLLKTADTSVCKNIGVQLNVTGGDSYKWRADTTLSNDSIPNPFAKPVITTTYYVQTKSAGFVCEATDSIKVSIKSSARFTISPDDTVCSKSNVLLSTTGGNIFSWQPANLVSNPAIANPVATAAVTTTFTVNIKDSVCGDAALLSTTIHTIPLPAIRARKSNDIDCFYLNAQLTATGGNSSYSWTARDLPLYLSDSSIANPLAFPSRTKTYFVTGSDTNTHCQNTDTIQVLVYLGNNPLFWAPNTFTPNGDPNNSCFKVYARSRLKYFELYIYNRWGEKVFETKDINECWDGTFKGEAQNPGNFVYYIRASNECKDDVTKGNLLLLR